MCIVCDNPWASELLNHLQSCAMNYCHLCMVIVQVYYKLYNLFCVLNYHFQTARNENCDAVCVLRTKAMQLQQITQIKSLLTEVDRVETFGLKKDYNPLLCIPADLYL